MATIDPCPGSVAAPLEFADRVVAWLLTYGVQSTTLLLGAAALSALKPFRSPAAREAIWKAALVGAILTAAVTAVIDVGVPAPRLGLPFSGVPESRSNRPAAVAAIAEERVATGGGSGVLAPSGASVPATRIVAAAWAAIAAALLARHLAARRRLRRDLAGRTRVDSGTLHSLLEEARARTGVRRRVRLAVTDRLASPVVLGASEIVLPRRAVVALDPREMATLLAHEMAHVARRDPAWLAIEALIDCVFFFQPLHRLARRRIEEAAEWQCDDHASRVTGEPPCLARCLARVAEWSAAARGPAFVAGMARRSGSPLVRRVERLLDERFVPPPPVARVPRLALAIVLCAVPAAAMAPIVVARQCLAQRGLGVHVSLSLDSFTRVCEFEEILPSARLGSPLDLHVVTTGAVRLTKGERDVESVAGGRLEIEDRSGTEAILFEAVATAGAAGLDRFWTFSSNGRRRRHDPATDGERLAALLRTVIANTPLVMEECVPRLLRDRGFAGVLAELSAMPLEPVRVLHFERLLEEAALGDADRAAAVAWARREVHQRDCQDRVDRAIARRFGRR